MGSATEHHLDADDSTSQRSSQTPNQSSQQRPSVDGYWRCDVQPRSSNQSLASRVSNEGHCKLECPEKGATDLIEEEPHDDSKLVKYAEEADRVFNDQFEIVEVSSGPCSSKTNDRQLEQASKTSDCYDPRYDSDIDSIDERDRLEQQVLEEWDQVIREGKADDLHEYTDEEDVSGTEGQREVSANNFLDSNETGNELMRSKLCVPASLWNDELRLLQRNKNSLVKRLKGIDKYLTVKNVENGVKEKIEAKADEMETSILSKLAVFRTELLQTYSEKELQNMYSKQMELNAPPNEKTKQERKRAKKRRAKRSKQLRDNLEEMNSSVPESPYAPNSMANRAIKGPPVNIPSRVNCGKGLAGDFPGQYDNHNQARVAGNLRHLQLPGQNGPQYNIPGSDFSGQHDNEKRAVMTGNMSKTNFPVSNGHRYNFPVNDFPGQHDNQKRPVWADNMRPPQFTSSNGPLSNISAGDFHGQHDPQNRSYWSDSTRHRKFLDPSGPHRNVPASHVPRQRDHQNWPICAENMRLLEFAGRDGLRCNIPANGFPGEHDHQNRSYWEGNMRHPQFPRSNGPKRNHIEREFPGQRVDQIRHVSVGNIPMFPITNSNYSDPRSAPPFNNERWSQDFRTCWDARDRPIPPIFDPRLGNTTCGSAPYAPDNAHSVGPPQNYIRDLRSPSTGLPHRYLRAMKKRPLEGNKFIETGECRKTFKWHSDRELY